jgi:spore coat protein CotH
MRSARGDGMRREFRGFSLVLGFAFSGAVISTGSVYAVDYSWDEQQARNRQREQQAISQQSQQGLSPSTLQAQRWNQQWLREHPGEPMPNAGQMQKMHRGEIINTMNNDFANMRQARQAELQQNLALARQMQERKLAAQHIKWSPQQWQNWNNQYQAAQYQAAEDYKAGVRQAGEIWQYQEDERKRREIYSPQ